MRDRTPRVPRFPEALSPEVPLSGKSANSFLSEGGPPLLFQTISRCSVLQPKFIRRRVPRNVSPDVVFSIGEVKLRPARMLSRRVESPRPNRGVYSSPDVQRTSKHAATESTTNDPFPRARSGCRVSTTVASVAAPLVVVVVIVVVVVASTCVTGWLLGQRAARGDILTGKTVVSQEQLLQNLQLPDFSRDVAYPAECQARKQRERKKELTRLFSAVGFKSFRPVCPVRKTNHQSRSRCTRTAYLVDALRHFRPIRIGVKRRAGIYESAYRWSCCVAVGPVTFYCVHKLSCGGRGGGGGWSFAPHR